jgi:hypothetical protein
MFCAAVSCQFGLAGRSFCTPYYGEILQPELGTKREHTRRLLHCINPSLASGLFILQLGSQPSHLVALPSFTVNQRSRSSDPDLSLLEHCTRLGSGTGSPTDLFYSQVDHAHYSPALIFISITVDSALRRGPFWSLPISPKTAS